MPHLEYFELLHYGPVYKIFYFLECLLLCLFSAFYPYSYKTLATVKLTLKQNNATYLVFGVGPGMNNLGFTVYVSYIFLSLVLPSAANFI